MGRWIWLWVAAGLASACGDSVSQRPPEKLEEATPLPEGEADAGAQPPAAPSGAPSWSLVFGSTGEEFGSNVAIGPVGNVFLAWRFSNGTTLAGETFSTPGTLGGALSKLGPSGAPAWTQTLTSLGVVQPLAVAVDANGSAAVVGNFTGSGGDFGEAFSEQGGLFIFKYRWDGEKLWGRTVRGEDVQAFGTLVGADFDAAGNLAIGGDFHGEGFDFGDGVRRSSGGLEHLALVVAKYDPNGLPLWITPLVAEGAATLTALAVSPSGQVVITFRFSGQLQLGDLLLEGGPASTSAPTSAIALLDADGTPLWSKVWSGEFSGLAFNGTSVAASGRFSGRLSFAGTTLTAQAAGDGLVVMLDVAGTELWAQQLAGAQNEHLADVELGVDGDLYVTGLTQNGPALFVNQPLRPHSLFIARMTGEGVLRWLQEKPSKASMTGGLAVGSNGISAVTGSHFVERSCSEDACQADEDIHLFTFSP